MERAHDAIKAAVDHLEAEKKAEEEYEEILMESPDSEETVEVAVSETPTEETEELFAGISDVKTEKSEVEREQLRLDNQKRTYQNAIGRLPYGIPSEELNEMDWVDLAAALATGKKKTSPEGTELTEIGGRWYYSDVEDTGTFLKEHGAKPVVTEAPRTEVAPTTGKAALLAKLEERFIMGEISEENYQELVEKYSKED
jgi:hypothetical protein